MFLKYLRPAARLRAEYQLALEELVRASGIKRDMGEDDLEQDLDWNVETLVERWPDPALIEGEISRTEAWEILESEGAFRETTFTLNEEESAALKQAIDEAEARPQSVRSHEEVWAEINARVEEDRRTIDLREYIGREQAIQALRWSGFTGPVFDAYWDDPVERDTYHRERQIQAALAR